MTKLIGVGMVLLGVICMVTETGIWSFIVAVFVAAIGVELAKVK